MNSFQLYTHTPPFRLFLTLAIPGAISMIASSLWGLFDGIFVGQLLGETAFAALNLAFPFVVINFSLADLIGVGAAVPISISLGRKEEQKASNYFTCACLLIFATGLLMGASFEANIGPLVLAILGKMVMSLGWASLYTFLNVVFRRYFGISVALSFFFGTGILIIGAAAVLGNSPLLNLFLYGSSVNACLSSNIVTLLTCIVVSVAWAVIYNLAGTLLLKKSDVY